MSTNPPLPPLGPLYGSFYFGMILCTALYGITCMQTFFYYVHYQNDSRRMKIFVAAIWVLDTIHEALSVAGVYKYIMAGLVDPYSYLIGNPELVLRLLCTAMIAVPTQAFFVYRIYIFSEKRIIAPLIWVLLAIVQFVTATIYVAKALYNANGVQVVPVNVLNDNSMMTLATLSLSIAAGVDVIIAAFLTFLLVRKRTGTGFTKTAHMLQRLTVFAVNTGIWTATFAVLTVILLHVYSTNALYTVPGIPLCSLYCNTLLANLNARAYIGGGETPNIIDMDLFRDSSASESTKAERQNNSGDAGTLASQQGFLTTTEAVIHSEAKRMRASESDSSV